MADATCVRCGATNGTVRTRSRAEAPEALCPRCYAAVTGGPADAEPGFTLAWGLLVAALLVVAAAAAVVIVVR